MNTDGTILYAGATTDFLNNGRMFTSIDYGVNWTEIDPTGLGFAERNWKVVKCNASSSVILTGIYGGRLYIYF
jgi:hypothetical protein